MRTSLEQLIMGNNSTHSIKSTNSEYLITSDNEEQVTKVNNSKEEDILHSEIPVLVSDEEMELILLVISCIIRGTVTFFGIIFNIINIIVFVNLGLQDTTNILFLSIAVADIGGLVTLLLGSICQNPPMFEVFYKVDMAEILFLASAWPHYYFARVSAILTCQLTVERYLCIAYPLSVRRLIRPHRVVTSIVAVYGITLISVVPVFASSHLGYEFSYTKNTTIYGLILSPHTINTIQVMNLLNNSIQIIVFCIVALTTTKLVHKLSAMSKWRKANASAANNVSSRDKKVTRMVISNAVSFIVSSIPILAIRFTSTFSSGLLRSEYYRNLMTVLAAAAFLTQTVHSTIRIFVYITTSSNYRRSIGTLFVFRNSSKVALVQGQ